MFRYSLIVFSSILLFSCSNQSQNQAAYFSSMEQVLNNSNEVLKEQNEQILTSFNEQLSDPARGPKAAIWYPKAEYIHSQSKGILEYIKNIKDDLKQSNNALDSQQVHHLFDTIAFYKGQILIVDPLLTNSFEKSPFLAPIDFHNNPWEKRKFDSIYFINKTSKESFATMTMLENAIRVIENRMILLCGDQISIHHFRFNTFTPLIFQNTQTVRKGEEVEVTAGVGAFSRAAQPKVYIGNDEIPISEDGAAHYKVKAGDQAGTYYIHAKIIYTNEEGEKKSVQRSLQYKVIE